MDQTTLINHTIKRSTVPPKYPAIAPIKTPTTKEIRTAINPMDNDILDPINTRLNKSRPYLSVPKRNFLSCT